MIKDDNAGLKTGQYWVSIKGTWLEDQSSGHNNLPEPKPVKEEVWSMTSQTAPSPDRMIWPTLGG